MSPTGSDWFPGTKQLPLKRIQTAIERVQPGGTIWIEDGTYQERLRITDNGIEGRPTQIQAVNAGQAKLTWEMDPQTIDELVWDLADGIHHTKVPWPIYRIVWDKQQLFRVPWGGVNSLKSIITRPNAFAAFWYENGELYVYLPDGKTPDIESLRLNARVPEPREWGEFKSANINLSGNHVCIDGLECEFGIGANIMIWGADYVKIANCLMTGATCGVNTTQGHNTADYLTISNCNFHNYPQGKWDDNWLTWKDIYAGYSISSLAKVNGNNVMIENCVASHVGDGIEITTTSVDGSAASIVKNNIIAFATDDALEFDGPAAGINVINNFAFDCWVGLSLSPVQQGPLKIHNNLFWRPSGELQYSTFAKILPPERWINRKVRNVTIKNNTYIGSSVCWWGANKVENFSVSDNVFGYELKDFTTWPVEAQDARNTYLHRETASVDSINLFESRFLHWRFPSDQTNDDITPGATWLNWRDHIGTRDIPRKFDWSLR